MILDDNLGKRIKSVVFIIFVVDKLVVCERRPASDFRVSFRVKHLNRDRLLLKKASKTLKHLQRKGLRNRLIARKNGNGRQ